MFKMTYSISFTLKRKYHTVSYVRCMTPQMHFDRGFPYCINSNMKNIRYMAKNSHEVIIHTIRSLGKVPFTTSVSNF